MGRLLRVRCGHCALRMVLPEGWQYATGACPECGKDIPIPSTMLEELRQHPYGHSPRDVNEWVLDAQRLVTRRGLYSLIYLIAGVSLIVAIADVGSGYYSVLRWFVLAACVVALVDSWKNRQRMAMVFFIMAAYMFFPPYLTDMFTQESRDPESVEAVGFHLARIQWRVVDGMTALMFLAAIPIMGGSKILKEDDPAPLQPLQNADATVCVVTQYHPDIGAKYHSNDECPSLSHSCTDIRLDRARREGYTPCSVCNPPQ